MAILVADPAKRPRVFLEEELIIVSVPVENTGHRTIPTVFTPRLFGPWTRGTPALRKDVAGNLH